MRSPLLFWVLGTLLSVTVWGRVSSLVPADSPIYDLYERLYAAHCLQMGALNFRPQTYADVQDGFFGIELEEDARDCKAPEWLMLEREVLKRPSHPNQAKAGPLFIYQDMTPLPNLDARINPMFPRRAGRPTFDGPNLYLELQANAAMGREVGVSAMAVPSFVGGLEDYRTAVGRFYVQEWNLSIQYHQAELMFGRVNLELGPARHGSLLYAGAGKPPQLLGLAVHPHVISPLGFLGKFSFMTWVAAQEANPFRNDSNLLGVILGFQPFDIWELHLAELFQFGGQGIAPLEFSDFARMLLYANTDDLDSRRQRGFLVQNSLWIWPRNMQLYAQLYFESLGRDDVSWMGGVWFPRLARRMDLRFEYVKTGLRAYQSTIWRQGFTYGQTPLGSALGSDAEGAYVDLGLPAIYNYRSTVGLSYEQRAKSTTTPETRYGFGLDVAHRWLQTELSLSARYQYVQNHSHDLLRDGSLWGAMATIKYSFL